MLTKSEFRNLYKDAAVGSVQGFDFHFYVGASLLFQFAAPSSHAVKVNTDNTERGDAAGYEEQCEAGWSVSDDVSGRLIGDGCAKSAKGAFEAMWKCYRILHLHKRNSI